MATKVSPWSTEQAKSELFKRLSHAKDHRRPDEVQWDENKRTLYSTRGNGGLDSDVSISFTSDDELGVSDNPSVAINYAFKNYRFIHSQLSANPPSVVARPTSNDPSDRRKADAADRLIRYAIRKYNLQELFDLCSANTLQYGTGIIKTIWDAELGDIQDIDEETGELIMEGDLAFSVPSPENIWLDPDAAMGGDLKWVFEEIPMPFEEACYRFGEEKKDILEKWRQKGESNLSGNPAGKKYDVVRVLQYWEKGLPHNGMLGRFCYCTPDCELLTPVKANPFRFSRPKDRGLDVPEGPADKERPGRAQLPYHLFTDIDVPGRVWGRSFLTYEAPLQDLHNRLINTVMDNVAAHGVARIILPEGAEIADDSITNSPWDVIKITGSQPLHFMQPMQMPTAVNDLITMVRQGLDDMAGVNEAMFGQQSREQSGFSMQYATNQGNLIRRRMFNKYVLLTESVFKAFLNLVRKYWNEGRTIYVLGKEKAFEAIDIKGADIDGGFDLVVEYGASLSLDPTTRREEILTLLPLFEKAGIDTGTVLQMLKLNELEGLYDRVAMAKDRQREEFEEMIKTGVYVPVRELQDHKARLIYAYEFVESTEYKYLDPSSQALIDRQVKEREMQAAKGAAPSAPGPLPQGPTGALPAVPGSGGPLDVTQQGPAIQQA
jgi:hypothetical protein